MYLSTDDQLAYRKVMGEVELVGGDMKYICVNPAYAAVFGSTPNLLNGKLRSTPFLLFDLTGQTGVYTPPEIVQLVDVMNEIKRGKGINHMLTELWPISGVQGLRYYSLCTVHIKNDLFGYSYLKLTDNIVLLDRI